MPVPTHRVVITREFVAALLSEHAYHRRTGRWPLLESEEIESLLKMLWTASLAPDVLYAPALRDTWTASAPAVSSAAVLAVLTRWFPALPDLFRIAGPHLAVMGGAVLQGLCVSVGCGFSALIANACSNHLRSRA